MLVLLLLERINNVLYVPFSTKNASINMAKGKNSAASVVVFICVSIYVC